jgi:cyclopropane fatty-acyl-phospholipid synthase-like methyltransferase
MTATSSLPVDASNAGQLRAWDGDEGAYWAAHAEHFDRAVARHHVRLMAAAAIGEDERVLDIGCGTGQTTLDSARAAGDGSALGTDLSAAMLAVARRRAVEEGVTNARFEQVDAQVHPFEPKAFDAVISRTGAMFFGDRRRRSPTWPEHCVAVDGSCC